MEWGDSIGFCQLEPREKAKPIPFEPSEARNRFDFVWRGAVRRAFWSRVEFCAPGNQLPASCGNQLAAFGKSLLAICLVAVLSLGSFFLGKDFGELCGCLLGYLFAALLARLVTSWVYLSAMNLAGRTTSKPRGTWRICISARHVMHSDPRKKRTLSDMEEFFPLLKIPSRLFQLVFLVE